jgi:putative DNA primase/helicase
MSQLPRAEREEKAREREIAAEDPTDKPGLIGAFCRAYTVEDAIAEFLPDVYGDTDPTSAEPRYTYLGGHSMYGAVVYDDKFMFSWHGTDPACEQLCNAWDLVRIHKFHEKDHKKDADTAIGELPSQKAMIAFAKVDSGVQKQLLEDSLDFDAMFDNLDEIEDRGHIQSEEDAPDDFGIEDDDTRELLGLPVKNNALAGLPDFPGKRKPVKTRKKWYDALEIAPNGQIKGHPNNLMLILIHDPRFRGLMALNAFTDNIVATRPIVAQIPEIPKFTINDKVNGDLWTDTHDAAVHVILSAPRGDGKIGYGLQATDGALQKAILMAAEQFKFHPLIDRLVKLPEWDGEDRISRLWIDYMGTLDTPYYRETATLLFVAALARVFCPGIAWDYVPILMGKENARKSTFVQDLAFTSWGGELSADLHNQQLVTEQIKAKWFLEMAEITGIKRSDSEMQKAFITRTTETVRLSYDRRAREFPRQCVFVGTTNEHTFLTANQNRRFWPIKLVVDVIDNDKLRENLDQMWAEALVEFKKRLADAKGDTQRIYFGLSDKAVVEARSLQDSIRLESTEDSDAPAIEDFLEKPVSLSKFLSEDGFEDLDDGGGDVMVLRVSTNTSQCSVEALGEELPSNRSGGPLHKIVRALHAVPGWITYEDWSAHNGAKSDKLTVPGYTRNRGFVRKNATWDEIALGYRVIEAEEEGSM